MSRASRVWARFTHTVLHQAASACEFPLRLSAIPRFCVVVVVCMWVSSQCQAIGATLTPRNLRFSHPARNLTRSSRSKQTRDCRDLPTHSVVREETSSSAECLGELAESERQTPARNLEPHDAKIPCADRECLAYQGSCFPRSSQSHLSFKQTCVRIERAAFLPFAVESSRGQPSSGRKVRRADLHLWFDPIVCAYCLSPQL